MSESTSQPAIVEWHLPNLLDDSVHGNSSIVEIDKDAIVLPSADEIEKIRKDAYDEGLRNGVDEGRKRGEAEYEQVISLVNNISDQLNSLSSIRSDAIVSEIKNTITAIVKQVIRREISISSEQIISVVKEGFSLLPSLNENITLKIHPDDAEIVETSIIGKMSLKVTVIQDPSLSSGGCHFETDSAKIDMSVETRMAKVFVNIMGGQRSDD